MSLTGLSADEFTAAFARHGRTLWVLAAAWVGRENAMDLVQETAALAWQRRDRFAPGSDARAWLSQIARHLGANERRRKRPLSVAPDELQPSAPLPAAHFDGSDLASLDCGDEITAALRELPATQRASLLLHVVSGHTFAEIGAMLEIPENTAASHARRARLALAETLSSAPTDVRTP
ncbi:MAG: RNA polymerase sigma factor [Planctomycetes bacterium]|nr:RNA polymerase sigma factor [Planctomycetota bacterium]